MTPTFRAATLGMPSLHIEAVPVLSLPAMIDRAMVAANWTDGSDNTVKSIDLIKGTLALAGLTTNDCMSAGEFADE